MTGLKWTHKTTRKVSGQLKRMAIQVSASTVGRLLKEMNYSLRVNHKTIESGLKNPPSRRDRNRQFAHIRQEREQFAQAGNPVISVDSKKRELIGQFKNSGRAWGREAVPVLDHDFPSDALGVALPYGIYDTQQNKGSMYVGTSHDTPGFAVDSIANWWKTMGCKHYPDATGLLILADAGGSNSCRSRVWKWQLQVQLCDGFELPVTVCHYPSGASKWNPVEHRLLCEVSKNWQGEPLDSYATVLNHIRRTETATGLRVSAHLVRKKYRTGERVSDKDMKTVAIATHAILPQWNYTLTPRTM